MIDECRKMFESRIFAAAIELHAKMVPWTYDMEESAKKCVGRYCKLAVEKTEQLYKVSTICLDDHNFKKVELETVGEMSKHMLPHCLEVLVFCKNCLTDIFMVREQTCSSGHRTRLTCFEHRAEDCRHYCPVRNTAQHCRFEDSESTSAGIF